MAEQATSTELQKRVDVVRLGLSEFDNRSDIKTVAFYAKPPWGTLSEQDLDLLIVVDNNLPDGTDPSIDEHLGSLAKGNIQIDAWILTPMQLTQRMKRMAGVSLNMPPIFKNISAWSGFGFVPVTGEEYLTKTINDCYSHPEPGGAIPPNPTEHKIFKA